MRNLQFLFLIINIFACQKEEETTPDELVNCGNVAPLKWRLLLMLLLGNLGFWSF